MRAENDIEDEEIEVHMAELSPRGFPIKRCETRKIYTIQNRNKKNTFLISVLYIFRGNINMERRNTGRGRIQLPEPKRMDARKYTRKETTRPNNSQGHNAGIKNTQPTRNQDAKPAGKKD